MPSSLQLEESELTHMPRYNIAFAGPLGCGKTTMARAWVALHPRWRMKLAFADALRREVATFIATEFTETGTAVNSVTFERVMQEMVGTPAEKAPYRKILQVWGTEVRRHLNGDDYWVQRLAATLDSPWVASHFAIDDARFANEFELLRERGFKIVLLLPNPEWDGWKAAQHHESERDWHTLTPDLELPWSSVENRLNAIRLAFEIGANVPSDAPTAELEAIDG